MTSTTPPTVPARAGGRSGLPTLRRLGAGPDPSSPTQRPALGWWQRVPTTLVVVLVTLVGCSLIVGGHIVRYNKVSPWDENAHIDSLYKARAFHVVRTNELIGQDAARETACRGVDSVYVPPPCKPAGELYDPTTFAYAGVNTATLHPPTYYFITANLARPLSHLPTVKSFVTAGRMVGILWLAGGLLTIWFAGAMVGAGAWPRAIAMVITGTAPAVIHTSSTVNNDAGVLLAGGLVLIGGIRVLQGRRHALAWLLVAAAFATLVKGTCIVGVGAVALMLLWMAAFRTRDAELDAATPSRRRLVVAAISSMAVAGLATKLWLLVLAHISHQGPAHGAPSHLTANLVGTMFGTFAPPFDGSAYAPFFMLKIVWIAIGIKLSTLLVVGTPLGALLTGREPRTIRAMAVGSLTAMYLGSSALFVLLFVGGGALIAPVSRYGVAAIPMIMVVLAWMLQSRAARIGATGIATYCTLVIAWALVAGGAPPPAAPPAATAPAPEHKAARPLEAKTPKLTKTAAAKQKAASPTAPKTARSAKPAASA